MDKQAYSQVPAGATLKLTPFTAHVPDQRISDLKQLLKLSSLGLKTFDNLQEDRRYGPTTAWMSEAKAEWEGVHDWRATEALINSFPNFTTAVPDVDGNSVQLHFVGVFSTNPSADALLLLHGWPGSFLEFLDLVNLLVAKYKTPAALPYHLIVPSIPGFGYSGQALPTDREWGIDDSPRVLDALMRGLGFNGYIAQGGDLGSYLARELAVFYPACRGMHLNMNIQGVPEGFDEKRTTPEEQLCLDRRAVFSRTGVGYQMIQATKPATLGFAISGNPVGLLAWIGEKLLAWSDADPPLSKILDNVALYWFTSSFATSIYSYKVFMTRSPEEISTAPYGTKFCKKPMGYSRFPKEITPMPIPWVAKTGNMVFSADHTEGGHFAALEKPAELARDIENCVVAIKKAEAAASHH